MSSNYRFQPKNVMRPRVSNPKKNVPVFFWFQCTRQELLSIQMRNNNIHPELVLQPLHRAVSVFYVYDLTRIRPCENTLYGCLTSDPKAWVASRQACLPSCTRQALQFCRGLSHEGTTAVDDASFSSATGLLYAATFSDRHLLL